MDVDYIAHQTVHTQNNDQEWINYNQSIGSRYSAMEHLIPESMFSNLEFSAEAVSAVKAITIASAEGQKIWTIRHDNLTEALAAINLDSSTEEEIYTAVLAGRTVITHDSQLVLDGWVGEGYIILDPETGAGAYKIAGGANGADLYTAIRGLVRACSH